MSADNRLRRADVGYAVLQRPAVILSDYVSASTAGLRVDRAVRKLQRVTLVHTIIVIDNSMCEH